MAEPNNTCIIKISTTNCRGLGDFLKKIYKCQSVSNDTEIQRLLQTLTDYPKLTNEEKNNIEGEITDSEILYVLKKIEK